MYRAKKGNRKRPFLKAFARTGTITGAAKACRISRDAIYDWFRRDPSFTQQFSQIKRNRQDEDFSKLQSALAFFQTVARNIVPAEVMPRLAAELMLAVLKLQTDLKGAGRHTHAPSEIPVGAPLPQNRFGEVAVLGRGTGASMPDLMR